MESTCTVAAPTDAYTVIQEATGTRQTGVLFLVPVLNVSAKATDSSVKVTVDEAESVVVIPLWAQDVKSREHMEMTEVVNSIFFI